MKKIFALVLLSISVAAFAQIPKPIPNTFVNDYAGVLDKADIKKLNKKINIIEKRAGIQLAIVLVDTLPRDYEIEEFSLLIGRKWGVGKNNDGLVYVAAISQKKQRLEVARNSEAKFTESRSLEILDEIKPYFRNQEYYGGVNKLVDEIAYDLDVDFQISAQQSAVKNAGKDAKWYEILGGLIVFLAPFALIYYIIKRRNRNRTMQQQFYSGYDGGGGYASAPRGYSSRPYSSSGSRFGSFAAGAAAGYLANELVDKLTDKEKEEEEEERRREQEEYEARQRENDESDYGNWGGGGSSGRSQSSNSGFSGGGATSDW
ncbi:MAG: hypothetical protein EOP46_12400 [Sphingobacteriaceae bacterium]|nr:MAG: hypothetical protein EOP46_12400 [Sphingobacteriaceae bacterium]